MIYHIVKNTVKPGTRKDYGLISREFCDAMEHFGAASAKVLFDEQDETTEVNITLWSNREKLEAFLNSGIPQRFYPRLLPYFDGNTELVLTEELS